MQKPLNHPDRPGGERSSPQGSNGFCTTPSVFHTGSCPPWLLRLRRSHRLREANVRAGTHSHTKHVRHTQHSRSFNPRPRQAGDFSARFVDRPWTQVSIHARVKRATAASRASRSSRSCFNPRPREAGDTEQESHCITFTPVSIHARVKRATSSFGMLTPIRSQFQSTPA